MTMHKNMSSSSFEG